MRSDTNVILSIDPGFKTIPYVPAERPEGSTCHGFKLLKGGREEDARAISEVTDLPCLADAIVRLNRSETPVFTVGCEKAFNVEGEQFWAKGFVEFAFNYAEMSASAVPYFVAFFHFNQFLKERGFAQPVQFHWELQGCSFLDAGRSMGFTCAVWITTALGPSEDVVKAAWCAAVAILAEYLSTSSMHGQHKIYGTV